VLVRDVEFLRAQTDRRVKATIPGPFTMLQQAQNDHYPDEAAAAMDYAAAVNAELRALKAAGADVVQLDEPYLQARPEKARRYALRAINRALEGVPGPTALHTCFGYAHVVKTRLPGYTFWTELNDCAVQQLSIEAAQPDLDLAILQDVPTKTIVLGVLNLDDPAVESPDAVARRIERALKVVPAARLQVAPDCGMKYLARGMAFAKLQAMVAGARLASGG
jgi:5-methyltetrahydropteroyltriglutamate--homocysteine methyltransferase